MLTSDPKLLGDPHLGRTFKKGIPAPRRGEREQLVREDFLRQLDPAGATVHICMGDLFDKPQVDYATVRFAYRAYRAVAAANPRTTFYIIQGNHDDSRDLEEITAWDLFCDNVDGVPNINCVTQPILHPGIGLFLPWHPTVSALEMVSRFKAPRGVATTTAYGHWDTDLRTASHNLIPCHELNELGITTAYTGHVHKPDQFFRDGVAVNVVGSMQPYAQGEDGGQCPDVRYATVSLEELLEAPPEMLKNVCIRLQLQPGEQFDGVIDCRSFDVQRLQPVDFGAPEDPSIGGFDGLKAFYDRITAHDIVPEVMEKIQKRYTETMSGSNA